MPTSYTATTPKKYLDADGLAHFAQKLNNYPTNDVIGAVIDGVQDALDEKLDVALAGSANGVATLGSDGKVPSTQLPESMGATYTLSQDPDDGHIVTLTSSSGSVQQITIPDNDTTYEEATVSASGLMSSSDKSKLNGIAAGANVSNIAYDSTNKKITKTINGTTSDVVSAANLKTDMNLVKGDVGLGNVENKSSATIRGELTSTNVTTALGYTPINSSLKGANNGIAELDASGKVPSTQLPSYVDDVLEYPTISDFPFTGESGKIYVDISTNKTYRWSGTTYTEISPSLALGETSSTAFRGDYGKIAYDHASAVGTAYSNGLYKITTNTQGHVTLANAVEKSDITALGIPAQDTTYESKSASSGGTAVSLVTTGEKYNWNNKASTSAATTSANGLMSSSDKAKLDGIASGATANTGTVTNIATGAGLTGGAITTSGTVKANLTSEVNLSNAAADGTETAGRVYPVRLDKNGKLAVNVPWTDNNTTYTFDGTYDASTNKAATVSTVTNAINALDGNLNNTTPGAGKTLTAFSETNGVVSATFGNISITKSQVSDFPALGAAAAKGVTDNSSATAVTSTDTNLITGRTLYYAGYTKNAGTITGINMNGASKGTSGVVDLGTVITSHQDISGKADKSSTVSNVSYDSTNNKITKTINGTTSDVVTVATLKTAMSLGNVENKSSATIRGEITSSNVTTALGFTPLNASLKGANNGVAELDSAGKVPASQLPSYVDDVLEYDKQSSFPTTGETGKIYVAQDTNKTYRWSGTAYVEISPSLALGETSSTAYRGDRGKAAYDHASAKGSAFASGLYKITTNSEGHVTAATAVAKADITGLGIPGSDTNTHRPIQVNGTEVLGNNTTALNLKAGSNVTVTNSSGTVTIAATDTTYSSKSAASGGTDVSLVTTGEKYTWNNKSNLTIGTSSTTAAAGNHTHGLSMATSSGTNAITLAASTKYQLTAGGSTYIFTTPPNTTYSAISNADIDALFS